MICAAVDSPGADDGGTGCLICDVLGFRTPARFLDSLGGPVCTAHKAQELRMESELRIIELAEIAERMKQRFSEWNGEINRGRLR